MPASDKNDSARPCAFALPCSGRLGLFLALAALSAGCATYSRPAPDSEVITIAEGYMVLNEPRVARALYEKALRKQPREGRAVLGLARVALKLGDYETALRELKRAQNGYHLTPPEEDSLRILLGRTYACLGRPKTAWNHLWEVWRRGDIAVKSSLDAEIKILARKVPPDTPGVKDVIAFRPPPKRTVSSWRRPVPATARSTVADFPKSLYIIPRSKWGARPPRRSRLRPMGKPYRITVHHSAHDDSAGAESWSEVASLIKKIQKYHMVTRGWADIGYHFIVDTRGRIWQGRSLRYQGAHAGDNTSNRGNIGIVVEGNFDYHSPTPAQIASLKRLINYLRRKYGIPAWQVHGHSYYRATNCPGKYLRRLLPSLR